jgi:hypothetical protein
MEDTLQRVEESIAQTWEHIDRQRHIIEVLHAHGYARDVPTAEILLRTLTASLEVLCEQRAILRRKRERNRQPGPQPESAGMRRSGSNNRAS